MGSYKWGRKSPNLGYRSIVTLLITPLLSTHEPTSTSRSCVSSSRFNSLVLSGEWGNGLLGLLKGTLRDYHRDPFPHSLLRTRE